MLVLKECRAFNALPVESTQKQYVSTDFNMLEC